MYCCPVRLSVNWRTSCPPFQSPDGDPARPEPFPRIGFFEALQLDGANPSSVRVKVPQTLRCNMLRLSNADKSSSSSCRSDTYQDLRQVSRPDTPGSLCCIAPDYPLHGERPTRLSICSRLRKASVKVQAWVQVWHLDQERIPWDRPRNHRRLAKGIFYRLNLDIFQWNSRFVLHL